MNDTNESIILKTYNLLKLSIPILNNFPKSQKFVLGDRIQCLISDILDKLIEAYYAPANEKRDLLNTTNVLLVKLRYYFRLCYDLGFIHSIKFGEFAAQIEEIGKMVDGWLKAIKNEKG